MTPDEVIAASQPRARPVGRCRPLRARPPPVGDRRPRGGDRALQRVPRLQPDNWTYKRQAWSLVGNEQIGGGEFGRFNQGPLPGQEDEWPFASDFRDDVAALDAGEYYPKTM